MEENQQFFAKYPVETLNTLKKNYINFGLFISLEIIHCAYAEVK